MTCILAEPIAVPCCPVWPGRDRRELLGAQTSLVLADTYAVELHDRLFGSGTTIFKPLQPHCADTVRMRAQVVSQSLSKPSEVLASTWCSFGLPAVWYVLH